MALGKTSGNSNRNWCVTWFNYDEKRVEDVYLAFKPMYLAYGVETCPTTGKQHLQMFLHRESKTSLKQLQTMFPGCHAEPMRGSLQQNQMYCEKEGRFKSFGEMPKGTLRLRKQSETVLEYTSRTPEVSVKQAIQDGAINTLNDLKFFKELRTYLAEPYRGERHVYWFWGPPGSGKSLLAFDLSERICKDNNWRCARVKLEDDGKISKYDLEEVVIFDDFNIDCENKFREFLVLTDRYPHTARVLFGTCPWQARLIFVTSERSPEVIYKSRCDPKQIIRRCKKIISFPIEQVECHSLDDTILGRLAVVRHADLEWPDVPHEPPVECLF